MTATQTIKAGKRWISHLLLLGIILKGPLRINASRIPRGSPELGSNPTASSVFHDDGQHGSHGHRHQPALAPTVSSEQQTNQFLEILNDDSSNGTVDPLCAADANPFADCLPSNTKTLKNFSKGTKQHISICLKFHQGLQCVTQYADRCFPPGTSDFLIPLNRSYARSCSHLRIGEEIIGERCYVELKPRWDDCVRILRYHVQKGDPVSAAIGANADGQSSGDGARSGEDVNDDAASDDAVLAPEALDQSGVPFGFGGNRNRC